MRNLRNYLILIAAFAVFCFAGCKDSVAPKGDPPSVDSLWLVKIHNACWKGTNPLWDFSKPLEEWSGVYLDDERRVRTLWWNNLGLSGHLDVSGLKNLDTLNCIGNNLTSLNVQGLNNLKQLWCGAIATI